MHELWRFPVKSLGGENLSSVALTTDGLEYDRHWGIADLETGNILSAKREGALLFATASVTDEGEVVIILPDGTQTNSDAALSRWLKRAVALTAAHDTPATYEAPVDFETESEWISWQGPSGSFHDSSAARVSVVTKNTLGDWDAKRFRSNIIIDEGDEAEWVGGTVTVGSCRLRVTKRLDRCVMVTRAQPGVDRDLDVLRTINRDRDRTLAAGALVLEPGTITLGDVIKPCD